MRYTSFSPTKDSGGIFPAASIREKALTHSKNQSALPRFSCGSMRIVQRLDSTWILQQGKAGNQSSRKLANAFFRFSRDPRLRHGFSELAPFPLLISYLEYLSDILS